MLANAVFYFFLCLSVCHGAVVNHRDDTGSGSAEDDGGRFRNRPPRPRVPGYVRYPVARHKFNGTGRWRRWGWHWSPPPGFPERPRSWRTETSPPWEPTTAQQSDQQTTTATTTMRLPASPAWPSSSSSSSSSSSTTEILSTSLNLSTPPPSWGGATISSLSTLRRPTTIESASPSPTQQPAIAIHQRATDRRWGWTSLEELGGIAYIIQLEIGTPPQRVRVIVDTGSYELWVNPRCSTSASASLCQSYGAYLPYKSNSSTHLGGSFAVTYGTGAVRGSYWRDVMSIAMFEIPSVQFAVANDSNYTFAGILGLGYAYGYSVEYPTLLNLMVSRGMINAPIFSLGLGGDGDGFSEIIFGGINRWKFAGALSPVKIWPPVSQQDPRWVQYWVNVTSVGMTRPGENPIIFTARDTFSMPTLIDTGSTLSYIREDLVATIGQQFRATVDEAGNYFVDCSYRDLPGTVDFGFNRGGMVINVRYKDFIYQQYPGGNCMLGVQPADVGSTNYVLGDTFIRGAYLVFDQQSDTVWMNQYYNCGDGVVTVGKVPRDTQYVVGAC